MNFDLKECDKQKTSDKEIHLFHLYSTETILLNYKTFKITTLASRAKS